MNIVVLKRKLMTAVTVTLVLLVMVIFLLAAGRVPIILILLTLISTSYVGSVMWRLRRARQTKL